ncbi:MAG: methyltransferase domain-containing protein, partial [Deltaproteobacteria bacterium]|nr:methyltransferase domain-containing protein [Deltaproteobacteria bacterium]
MEIDKRIIRDLPDPFNFYYLLTSAGHLHFGLWPDDSPDLILEEAQEKMFTKLLAFFPRPPASVLDVGCGFGVSAHSLSQRGYEVTGIAPSAALIRHAAEHFGNEYTDFQVADFLGATGAPFMEKSYDVILFQESLQYFSSPAAVFQRCRALLNPKGIVIIGDEIREDDTLKDRTAVHSHREVLLPLHENGFRLTRHLQIGSQVKKTCDQVIDVFTRDFDHLVTTVDQPDAAERLHYFLAGWKSQQEWYAAGRMGYELFMIRKDQVYIRAYQEGDEEQILPMFNRIFFQQRSLEHWRWKYRDNPFGSQKIVVAVDDEGTLAGHFAAFPVPYHSPATKPVAGLVFHGGDT